MPKTTASSWPPSPPPMALAVTAYLSMPVTANGLCNLIRLCSPGKYWPDCIPLISISPFPAISLTEATARFLRPMALAIILVFVSVLDILILFKLLSKRVVRTRINMKVTKKF